MKRVRVKNLEPGMEVAKTIYSARGQVLLSAGVKLKENYITRLKELNITEIYVIDERLPKLEIPEPLSNKTRLQATKIIKETIEEIKIKNTINFRKVRKAVNNILDEILFQDHIVIHLSDIRSYDDYTFHHSVNVTILSILIATNFDYNKLDLRKIAIGSFLHDVGKTLVDKDIIMKPDKLTDAEYDAVKEHSNYGYDIVRDIEEISILAAHIAYQHHEKLDGSGYPRGLKGEEITDFAQIVAVADIYDALTSDRVYRKKLMPHEALKIVRDLEGTKLNSKYVEALTKHIAAYPIGTRVKLSNGELGVVVDVNKENLSAPIIRIIEDEQGNEIKEFLERDLIHEPEVTVVDVVEY